MKSIWFVPHPTSQFKEDVKLLAAKNQLKVIDARFDDGSYDKDFICSKPPKLTPIEPLKHTPVEAKAEK